MIRWFTPQENTENIILAIVLHQQTSLSLSLGLDADTLQFNKTTHGITSWFSKKNLFKFSSGLSRLQLC